MPGVVLVIAGCNEKVFSPKPWKKFSEDSCCCFRKKRKNHLIPMHSNPTNTVWRHRATSITSFGNHFQIWWLIFWTALFANGCWNWPLLAISV